MPHPTPRHIAYGSATVILSTLLPLLLAPGVPGAAVAALTAGALGLGLLVTVTLTARRRAPGRTVASGGPRVPVQRTHPMTAPDRPGARV
ncbi:hypothetical protein GCM10009716_43950 [Streptomyces sodiiphilus]|uniref:Uncharacterized protein n=1 Tax=Streptomyces sodiiphilus TaxID=226217 RepID=A0ABN2PWE3_9ACTN